MRILKGADEGRSLLSVSRIRDFLRIPYLYTIPDDYTPGDESYKDDPDYLEDDKVDKELSIIGCLLYTSPSPRDRQKSRMPSSA